MGQPQPVAPGAEFLRQLRLDLSTVRSEQEFMRTIESALPHPDVQVRISVFGLLISQALSILQRYREANATIKAKHTLWRGQLQACTVGHIQAKVIHSNIAGGYMYELKVVGAEGVDPKLSDHPSTAAPPDVDLIKRILQDNLHAAQECRFRMLHAELREALADVGWLQDDFGHADPDAVAARERMGVGH